METKKAKKAREIAERKAAKEAAKKAEYNRVFAMPLAKAVEPLKVRAVAQAEIRARKWVKDRLEELKAANWDLNKVAPYPKRDVGPIVYRLECNRRHAIENITKAPKGGFADRSWDDMNIPRIVERDSNKIAKYVDKQRKIATYQYEAFVFKMVKKVGEHTAARLEDIEGIWGYSHLYVTMPDGSVVKWRTQEIFNTSIYGKVFPQWPSRIVK